MNEKFESRVTQALDDSVDQLDADVVKSLESARKKALKGKEPVAHYKPKPLMYSAIAATLVLALAFPIVKLAKTGQTDQTAVTYLDVDPEMLELMDVLMLLEELDGDSSEPI